MNHMLSHARTLAEIRSSRAFAGMLFLVCVALAFPEMPIQGLLGILWAGTGLLMILLPPEQKLPRTWLWLAVGFVGLAALGFLPRDWFPVSPWRSELEALGLDTGNRVFLEPVAAAEALVGFAVTAAVVLFMLGHRTNSSRHHGLMLAFAVAMGIWTVTAMVIHEPGTVFGFFPNRNHSACLLAMATFAGLGSLVHAIRAKQPWKIAGSVPPPLLTIWSLFAISESRAGVVLLVIGFLAWGLLAGTRVLKGHAGKALLIIVIAAAGAFMIGDFTAKKRLSETVVKLAPAINETTVAPESYDVSPAGSTAKKSPFATVREVGVPEPRMDSRLSIFKAALGMVTSEPWTGVGPGRFVGVFPQYRESVEAPNNSRFLHPESDWIMMLAETGWLATICLVLGVAVVFLTAIRRARRGRARLLKTAGIVSALLLCVHAVFDVPGHRVGLAWGAALMLAMALRSSPVSADCGSELQERRPYHMAWRALGILMLAAGAALAFAQWSQKPLLPSVMARNHMQIAKIRYDQDQAAYDKATAEGVEYDPPADQDPLVAALHEVALAIQITPLDPYMHYIQGALALHYDDRQEIARRAFAIQRRLDPFRVNLATEQARSWMGQNSQEALVLWKEAMERARSHQALFPHGPEWVLNTYRTALRDARDHDEQLLGLLVLADTDLSLTTEWAQAAPAALLDREMPRLLISLDGVSARTGLFHIWQRRGNKDAAQEFLATHPELGIQP